MVLVRHSDRTCAHVDTLSFIHILKLPRWMRITPARICRPFMPGRGIEVINKTDHCIIFFLFFFFATLQYVNFYQGLIPLLMLPLMN